MDKYTHESEISKGYPTKPEAWCSKVLLLTAPERKIHSSGWEWWLLFTEHTLLLKAEEGGIGELLINKNKVSVK